MLITGWRELDPHGVLNPGVLLPRAPGPEPRTPGGREG